MSTVKPENNWKLESGWLCLDFANTAEWHASDHLTEGLTSYAALIGWARPIGFLPDRVAQQLLRAADQHPAEAARVLDRAVALREAIYHLFAAVARGRMPSADDQSILNAELSRSMSKSQLVWNKATFNWERQGEDGDLDQLLWWI